MCCPIPLEHCFISGVCTARVQGALEILHRACTIRAACSAGRRGSQKDTFDQESEEEEVKAVTSDSESPEEEAAEGEEGVGAAASRPAAGSGW